MTATASTSSMVLPASSRAFLTVALMNSQWRRLAISGTTPPYSACSFTLVEMTLLSRCRPSSTRAAAVSSQVDSIPKTIMFNGPPASFCLRVHRCSGARRTARSLPSPPAGSAQPFRLPLPGPPRSVRRGRCRIRRLSIFSSRSRFHTRTMASLMTSAAVP